LLSGAVGRDLPIGQSSLLSQIDAGHRFELSEIEVATENFENIIGKGGFGLVYYGKLCDGIEVAVKVHSTESKQGILEFTNEVHTC
jgi:predicted Ser/Thr protein kinase